MAAIVCAAVRKRFSSLAIFWSPCEVLLGFPRCLPRTVRLTSCSQWNDGFRARSGYSRGGPVGRAFTIRDLAAGPGARRGPCRPASPIGRARSKSATMATMLAMRPFMFYVCSPPNERSPRSGPIGAAADFVVRPSPDIRCRALKRTGLPKVAATGAARSVAREIRRKILKMLEFRARNRRVVRARACNRRRVPEAPLAARQPWPPANAWASTGRLSERKDGPRGPPYLRRSDRRGAHHRSP